MPRPRKPTQVLELTGAFRKNPQRRAERANEPVENDPLGPAPTYLSVREQTVWAELAACLVEGVALASDRSAFAHLIELEVRRRRRKITPGERQQLHRLMVAFGMTPADRSRVEAPRRDPRTNPFAVVR